MVFWGVRASVTFFTKKCVFLMKASLLHEVELPHVLDLAVLLVTFLAWWVQGRGILPRHFYYYYFSTILLSAPVQIGPLALGLLFWGEWD